MEELLASNISEVGVIGAVGAALVWTIRGIGQKIHEWFDYQLHQEKKQFELILKLAQTNADRIKRLENGAH